MLVRFSIRSAALTVLLISGHVFGAVDLIGSEPASGAFPLVSAGKAAAIVLPPDAPGVVKIAARDLAADIAAISGASAEILTEAPGDKTRPRVELVFAPDLSGKWEAFRLSAKPGVLTISGSDRRGLAYGIYEISQRIGVSPWNWWADVPVTRCSELRLSLGDEPVDQPAVKYRGIFINDEDWGLHPWAAKTHEPEVKDIGPRTYTKIFELLLRLRANTLWPAMHECTKAFHLIPGNAAAADAYSIVLGSSHAEPMLRSNTSEWSDRKEDYNYLKNPDGVLAYWEQRVKERASGESLFTIGMRGIHDSPIVGPKTQPERIATVEKIFAEQRGLLARYLGKGDPTRVGQIFCPYKEVLEDYNAGLKVPDDVPIVWPDDNFGYVRRFATPAESKRSGGLGVYYHASYLGAPLAWLWIDTLPPALVWSEMTRAYEQGARSVWIVNVGDIKNTERSMEFFLDLAWHADRTNPEAPARFMRETAARDFGEEHAAAVADLLSRVQSVNFARKSEHLQWHDTLKPYQPTELNEAEIARRLKICADLMRDSDNLADRIPSAHRDAYFELVGYPAAITAAANERYFRAELARADEARGRDSRANREASAAGQKRVTEATARYNNSIAGGKWRHIVTENGVFAKDWKRFQYDTRTVPPKPAADNVCPPAPPALAALPHPSGAKPGDFVERDGVVSIHVGNFAGKNDLPSGAGWRSVPGLGRTGSAVTVLPSTATIAPTAAPSLDYRFHITTNHPATLHVRLLPTHPLVSGQGLRLAVSIDGAAPLPLAVTSGFDPKSKEWSNRVLSNAAEATIKLPNILKPGAHTLRLIAVDAGVVVDKIVLDLGGLKPSYDGPAETRVP
jgi:Glycosyl hydrolase family 115/Gylcosyl hydrolase family 115 C-terminal domain